VWRNIGQATKGLTVDTLAHKRRMKDRSYLAIKSRGGWKTRFDPEFRMGKPLNGQLNPIGWLAANPAKLKHL